MVPSVIKYISTNLLRHLSLIVLKMASAGASTLNNQGKCPPSSEADDTFNKFYTEVNLSVIVDFVGCFLNDEPSINRL